MRPELRAAGRFAGCLLDFHRRSAGRHADRAMSAPLLVEVARLGRIFDVSSHGSSG